MIKNYLGIGLEDVVCVYADANIDTARLVKSESGRVFAVNCDRPQLYVILDKTCQVFIGEGTRFATMTADGDNIVIVQLDIGKIVILLDNTKDKSAFQDDMIIIDANGCCERKTFQEFDYYLNVQDGGNEEAKKTFKSLLFLYENGKYSVSPDGWYSAAELC